MMAVKICAYRTRDRAAIWFFDPIGIVIASLVVGGALLAGAAPWWVTAPVMCVGSSWFVRIQQMREHPAIATLTTFWTVIPLRRRKGAIATLGTRHADDFTAGANDPDDEIVLDGWTLFCWRADRVAESIRTSAVALTNPTAEVKRA